MKHLFAFIWIQTLQIATPQSQHRDEPQDIARLLQCGHPPIRPIVAAAHDPGDEGTPGHRRPENNGGGGIECTTTRERSSAHFE